MSIEIELFKWIDSKRKTIKESIESCGDVEKETINQADLKFMLRARLGLLEELERKIDDTLR